MGDNSLLGCFTIVLSPLIVDRPVIFKFLIKDVFSLTVFVYTYTCMYISCMDLQSDVGFLLAFLFLCLQCKKNCFSCAKDFEKTQEALLNGKLGKGKSLSERDINKVSLMCYNF